MVSRSRRPRGRSRPLESLLAEAGLHVDSEVFLASAAIAVREIRAPYDHLPAEAQFTFGELAALERGGLRFDPFGPGERDPIADTAAAFAVLLADSISVAEAADILHVHESRIRQLLGERALHGIRTEGGWRLPRAQFHEGALVRGLGAVLRAATDDLHPVELWRWLSLPDPDLEIGDVSVSPMEWLLSGGDPERVAAIARDL